ncbi:protein FLX-like 1 [Nicotiana sylvestris]|uniref:protein FLX-like 1 n=1 Tax=Nicotiana sylvestris TaxID=4096 RepID=UPI00388C54F2
MDAMDVAYLFNKAQHALNRASVLHHEAFFGSERNARSKSSISVRNAILISFSVRQRLEQIKGLQGQIDKVRAEVEHFKECMDILAAQKDTVQAELDSAKSQLRYARDNASVQAKKVEELESNLANLAKELEVSRFEVATTNIKAQANAYR